MLRFVHRRKVLLIYFATAWISLAFFGYGVALKQRAAFYSNGPNFQLLNTMGNIQWADTWFARYRGVRFKLEESSQVFYLLPESISDVFFWKKADETFSRGKRVSLSFTPTDGIVLAGATDIGTFREKRLPLMLYWASMGQIRNTLAQTLNRRAMPYLLLGIFLIPIVIVVSVVVKRFALLRKIKG